MAITVLRTLILYGMVMLMMRVMGKRQLGEMQPFELVVTILVADLAAVPMQDNDIPLLRGILPLLTLLLAELIFSYLTLHSTGIRRIISGTPSVVVENGKIVETQLRRLRYNLNDLLEQLRLAGYADIQDVEFAILETSGHLSVIPKSQKRPVTPADLGVSTDYEGLPYTLIVDGKVNKQSLTKLRLTDEWLMKSLQERGFSSPKQVLFATLNTQGQLFIQGKEKLEKLPS